VGNRERILQDADSIKGRRTGLKYKDLERLLLRAGCGLTGKGSSHRVFTHASLRQHLVLNEHPGDVLPVYVRKTEQFLRLIAGTL
jgi:hypothetical protein